MSVQVREFAARGMLTIDDDGGFDLAAYRALRASGGINPLMARHRGGLGYDATLVEVENASRPLAAAPAAGGRAPALWVATATILAALRVHAPALIARRLRFEGWAPDQIALAAAHLSELIASAITAARRDDVLDPLTDGSMPPAGEIDGYSVASARAKSGAADPERADDLLDHEMATLLEAIEEPGR